MDLVARLIELCDAFGPPGAEEEVRALIRAHVEHAADEIHESPLGNLVVTRRGVDKTKTLLLDAHMDEVGLMVSHVEPSGFLRFATIGTIDNRVLPAQRVTVRSRDGTKRLGVIGAPPPHVTKDEERSLAFDPDGLVIDLGCRDAQAVEALGIGVGAPAVFHAPARRLEPDCVTAKALDDRAGCVVLMGVLEALGDAPPPVNVVASFTVQEETGGLGARTAANVVAPEAALALEGTTAVDTPGVAPHKVTCALRGGPAITVADAVMCVPEKLVRFLQDQAKGAGIPCQLKTPRIGSMDARLIQQSGGGVLTGVVSVPCRYIHSSTSVLCVDDLAHTRDLVSRFVANAAALWS